MRVDRKLLLKIVIGVGGALVGVAVLTPIGDFFVEYWRARGVYDNPQAVVNAVAGSLSFTTELWFQLFATAVLCFGAGMWVDDRWRRAERKSTSPAIDYVALGKECTAFHDELASFLVDRATAAPPRLKDAEADYTKKLEHSQKTKALINQRFSHRALALSQRLEAAGIRPPNWSMYSSDPNIASFYIGAIGDHLTKGEIETAKSLDPNGKIVRYLGH